MPVNGVARDPGHARLSTPVRQYQTGAKQGNQDTVSRGPSAVENGSLQLTLGAGRPPKAGAVSDPVPATLGASGAEPAAKVGDRVITVAEVDQEWRRTDP